MSEKIDIIVDSSTDVEAGNEIVSTSTDNNIDIEILEPEYDITINKREYVITGDNLYIPKTYDESPQWIKDIIGTITDFSLNQKLTEIGALSNTLYALIDELEVAKNTYTNSIITSAEIDERINARIETLNSSIAESDATIVDLITTKATPTEASSLALNVLTSSINDGAISSLVTNLQNAISTSTSTLANNIDIVHAEMTGEFNANAEVINSMQAYVGIDEAGASTGTGVSAYLEGSNGVIGSADSKVVNNVYVDNNGNSRSKFEYNSSLNIGGNTYNSGFGLSNSAGTGVGSEFWINADKFKFTNNGKTGSAAPFTIDASGSQPQITFNGKVTFGSGQVGTIDQAIAAVVETVAVGDKNINITDNLIPTTSLVADTDNSGYQFIGTPTKSMSAGLESFSEAQIILDGSDEVYSPYVDEVTIPYYYRFGIKGITNLDRFKIVTIDSSNVVLYNDITVTMEVGQILSAGNWYTVDGVINPTGGVIAADGDIRDINGVKVGSINNFVMPSGTTKVLLGWIADCTISRMKMCKITADTITSDFSSVNGQLVDLNNQVSNIGWNSLSGKDVLAQKFGYATYSALESAATAGQTVVVGGKINTELIEVNAINANQINTTGLIAENIRANEIVGKTITGSTLNGAVINGAVIKASYLDLDGELEVLTNYHITVAMYNANPSLYTDSVYIEGSDEYRIPSISTVKEDTVAQNISANGAVFNSKIRSYNCANVGHNMKCVKIQPTITTNPIDFLKIRYSYSDNQYDDIRVFKGRTNSFDIYFTGVSLGTFFYVIPDEETADPEGVYRNGVRVSSGLSTYNFTVDSYTYSITINSDMGNPTGYIEIVFRLTNYSNYIHTIGTNFNDTSKGLFSITNNGGSTVYFYPSRTRPGPWITTSYSAIAYMNTSISINNMI